MAGEQHGPIPLSEIPIKELTLPQAAKRFIDICTDLDNLHTNAAIAYEQKFKGWKQASEIIEQHFQGTEAGKKRLITEVFPEYNQPHGSLVLSKPINELPFRLGLNSFYPTQLGVFSREGAQKFEAYLLVNTSLSYNDRNVGDVEKIATYLNHHNQFVDLYGEDYSQLPMRDLEDKKRLPLYQEEQDKLGNAYTAFDKYVKHAHELQSIVYPKPESLPQDWGKDDIPF
jgi:hypothetical protein